MAASLNPGAWGEKPPLAEKRSSGDSPEAMLEIAAQRAAKVAVETSLELTW